LNNILKCQCELNKPPLKNRKMEKQDRNKSTCPFLEESDKDCYCSKMDSNSIKAAIYYCGKNFEECSTYNKLYVMQQNKPLTLPSPLGGED